MTNSPHTSAEWHAYFQANQANPLPIPWQDGAQLTITERYAVARSIQEFQLGESSEGHHLYRAAQQYATQSQDPAYLQAIRFFIREEQHHARLLKQFLLLESIPTIKQSWSDTIFRLLRRDSPLEVTISILVTAEIFAQLYYDALQQATGSSILQAICRQVLADEAEHIRFHVERLALIRQSRGLGGKWVTNGCHYLLFAGTLLVVWHKHHPVFEQSSLTFYLYWQACWQQFHQTWAKTPSPYDLLTLPSPSTPT